MFINGLIRTMDPDKPVDQAVAVKDGRFLAVGSTAEVLALKDGSGTDVVDLNGGTVLPGFIDGHAHLFWFGQSLAQIDLADCWSIGEMRRRLKDRAAQVSAGDWILGFGWHQERFQEKRDPSRLDIDDISPLNPVYFVRSCTHTALANSFALRAAGIDRRTADPPGGMVMRAADGEPSGLIHENAMKIVAGLIPEPTAAQKSEMLRSAMNEMAKYGITSVHSIDYDRADTFLRMASGGDMPVRVYMDEPMSSEEEISSITRRTGDGDDWLRTGAVKFWADGAFGPHTAALREPYADDPGNRGLLVYEPAVLKRLAVAATRAGRQIRIHALGDRAMDVALNAIEEAVKVGAQRPRIAHCGIVEPEMVARMKRLGVAPDLQAICVPYDAGWMPGRVGPERSGKTYPIKSLLDAGLTCSASADAPVYPIDPMAGIHAAVTRAGLDGQFPDGWNPEERVSVEEAVRIYTTGGAYAEFSEKRKGIIRVGYLADMAILSSDIFDIEPAAIPLARVIMTVVGGDIKWTQREPG